MQRSKSAEFGIPFTVRQFSKILIIMFFVNMLIIFALDIEDSVLRVSLLNKNKETMKCFNIFQLSKLCALFTHTQHIHTHFVV